MILDSLRNSAIYYALNPRLEAAFNAIAITDWLKVEPGIHEIQGRDIYVNVMDATLKTPANAKLEVHNEYIDIQVLVCGDKEGFGWSDRAEVCKPIGDFDSQKDVQFFDDEHQTCYILRPGQFSILMPEDAHAPMIGEGDIRKIIVKVRI